MNFETMEASAIEERANAIKAECLVEGADLNSLEEEARAIHDELERRKAAEAKKVEARKNAMNGKEIKQKEDRKMFEVDSKEYRIAWLKTLQGKPLDEEERGYTQSSTYATNAIPTEVAGKFFEKMKKLAPMLSEITLFRAAGNLKFVAEGTRNAATSHVENSAITAAADTTVAVTLGAVEFMKVVGISKSAARMSVDDFENWIVDYLAGDIARAIDNYILNDATHGVTAITFTTATNQIMAASTGMTYGDVCDLIALLPAAYDPDAKFLTNKATLYGAIANITNSAGNPIFVPDPTVGLGRIMGYPVLVDDYVATANSQVYLGKWSDVVGNLSEGVIVERDESSGFLSGTINYRGYASFDSAPAKIDGIVRLMVSST